MPDDFRLVGADLFILHHGLPPVPRTHGDLHLDSISNRGTRLWPGDVPEGLQVDSYRCRYLADEPIDDSAITALLAAIDVRRELRWVHVEKLHYSGDVPGFSAVS